MLDLLTTGESIMYQIEVDPESCIGCGECIEACPADVFEIRDEKSTVINEEGCVGCGSCLEICQEDAITLSEI